MSLFALVVVPLRDQHEYQSQTEAGLAIFALRVEFGRSPLIYSPSRPGQVMNRGPQVNMIAAAFRIFVGNRQPIVLDQGNNCGHPLHLLWHLATCLDFEQLGECLLDTFECIIQDELRFARPTALSATAPSSPTILRNVFSAPFCVAETPLRLTQLRCHSRNSRTTFL